MRRLRAATQRRSPAWLDVLIAVIGAAGLTASTLYDAQIKTSTFAASDFKTLYASVWCFTHRLDAYKIPNLQRVFDANGVIQPEKWFGHAPVYPWATLALLSPLGAVGMVFAIYVLTILSGALLGVAIAVLMRYAENHFDLGLPWRIAIAGLCLGCPLLAFGMDMGNVSVAASALCLIAFAWRKSGHPWSQGGLQWIPGAALAIAFLLKPHLAVWVGVGMLALPERAARSVVARASALVAGFVALTAGVLAAIGTLRLETHAYLAMLAAETSVGSSMNAASREVMPVVAQITSLESIVGFWVANPEVRIAITLAVLLGLGALLVWWTRRVNTEPGALLAVSVWCTLGMLATYHRAHDAAILLLLTPWVVDRVRRAPLAWHSWATAAVYCAMSASADFPIVERWVEAAPVYSLTAFVLLRQAGLADFLLLVVLLLAMRHEQTRSSARVEPYSEPDELQAAA
jgi:hypothetical protein